MSNQIDILLYVQNVKKVHMIKRPNDIPNYLELVANLEEFGLSKYESMAYITLVSRGTLGASEIAYYSNLPRTKIYTTLKKLERKKLSTISSQKPMIATATPPNEAFGELITLQERRLSSMYNILDSLKKLREEGKKSYEEKKYLTLEPNVVVQKIKELISSSKSNIDLILDSWGQNVVFQCRPSITGATKKGVKIKMLLGNESIISEGIGTFPDGVEIRSDTVSGNILIFDYKKIIFIDSTNGKASLILTADPYGSSYVKLFDEKWKKALRLNTVMLGNKVPKEALTLSKIVENDLSQILLDMSIMQDNNYTSLINEIEKFSSETNCQSIEEIVSIVDYALRISYSGYLKYENQENMLKLHFDSKERSMVPWAIIIVAYVKKFGNDAQIIYDNSQLKANTIYIKLLHPAVIHAN
ncbi:MAG: helix-turn-helix domain-containing protein [Nitrososphaeraceae archaeon]|nr:helix-turn-helix domain-containing protein [Nitrososphaeraceae archaeon]MDW0142807.1 helix-turn-helix domain-containing protein [Nitrososphaeraceae archaeon]MDW0144149.1 helix-turn-helix domain-containing protein [Nitrososphaeraceae archaeon]MDW0146634.1 helix-turn-helix domain-containing protein [Nitrososphaeraceae archaeon]MDW0148031.1 helix-turn-helix domain-containing protein [Nitrososphaeraceae archaeon]